MWTRWANDIVELDAMRLGACLVICSQLHASAYVSIRQHTSAYVELDAMRQHTSAYIESEGLSVTSTLDAVVFASVV